MSPEDARHLVAQVVAGSSQAAARLISLLENDGEAASGALRALFPHTGRAHVVGITGPPGSGKSTLVNEAVRALRVQGQRVGVVAVDPTSPFTGGALLGDRIRMQDHSTDPEVFVRSMATRGSLGGLAPATGEAVAVLDAWGAAKIFVETVGTGQAEVDVIAASDTVVVVTTPGLGDGVQTLKAGVMEIGDVFVVNKADKPDVDRTVTDLKMALGLIPAGGWRPPVLTTIATTGEGTTEVLAAVAEHRRYQVATGGSQERRRMRWRREIVRAAEARLRAEVLDDLVERVDAGETDPHTAAASLLAGLPGRPELLPQPRPTAAPDSWLLGRIDHIGIAVRSIAQASRFYQEVLGLSVGPEEHLPEDGVTVAFVPVGDTRIELLEPLTPGGPVARFLERHGEGIHHIAFAVPDIAGAIDAARNAGYASVDETPRRGAHGSKIAFLHPSGTHGVLIELVELP
jgi:LAO/AO transport system kinase